MRRLLIVVSVVGLVLGSLTAASAMSGVPIQDLFTAVVDPGQAPDSAHPVAQAALDPDEPGHDHAQPDAPGHDAAPAALDSPAVGHLPENDHAKGLVFDGLRPGAQNGPCDGAYEIPLANGTVLCTPGPEAGPPGLDVRADRSVADLAQATAAADATEGTAETGSGVPCIGDGVSGNRVQAIYAVAADRVDRYADIAPLIAGWAGGVDHVFSHSAAQVGGERHVRFVTDANCGLDVAHVVVSPIGDDNIMNTINELSAAGYNRPDRKYLIWMDASTYCGIAQIFRDDRPGQDNLSNVRSGYARVDQNCWGGTYSAEAHELVHSLGGVQPSVPHASANFHCTDEEDRMCYKDGVDVVLTFDCPPEQGHYLDCNHDDYYHPNPPAGSYLESHWNVADSSFLHAGPVGDPAPPPSNAPPVVDAGPDLEVTLADGAVLQGSVEDDALPGGILTSQWVKVGGPGDVSFGDGSSPATDAAFSEAGEYVLELSGDDGEFVGTDTTTVTVTDDPAPPPPPDPDPDPGAVVEVFESSLNKRFPARSHEVTNGAGSATATLTFSSKLKGKNAAQGQLTVNVYTGDGTLVATASGPNVLSLSVDLPAGVSTFEVAGGLRTSYTLQVAYLAP